MMQYDNLYDLRSFDKMKESAGRINFGDSIGGVTLERHLTQVDPNIFKKQYPDTVLVNSGITADNTGGYAQVIQSLRLRNLGGFTNSSDKSDTKGTISLTAEDSLIKVFQRTAKALWEETEVEQAAQANRNLVSDYMAATNEIYIREVEEIGMVGINSGPASGLLDYSGFTSNVATATIANLTAQQMYDEYATLITDQHNGVNNTGAYMATRVFTPNYCINTMAKTMLNTANGSSTVLKALKDNFPGVEFIGSHHADDVGGSSSTVACSVDRESLVLRIPQPLRIGEIIKVGSFDFKVDAKYRIAGLDVLEDTSGRILTGL